MINDIRTWIFVARKITDNFSIFRIFREIKSEIARPGPARCRTGGGLRVFSCRECKIVVRELGIAQGICNFARLYWYNMPEIEKNI
ncbi:MAG: hypothetical protein K2I43_06895, partial [Alistipes sp.]|nr:hypothetical protein [Alistipes sp.]